MANYYAVRKESSSFLLNLVPCSWAVLGLMVVLQCVFFPGLSNFTCISYVVMAWLLNSLIFLNPKVLKNHPLSSFLIIGFTCTQFYFPLVFTTIEGKALINNLEMPQQVFTHSMLSLLVLVLVHAIYRRACYKTASTPSRGPALLKNLHFFEAPSDMQIWLMGILGLVAMFCSSFILKAGGNTEVGIGGKIIEGFISFTYAPFFIPFGKLYGKKKMPGRSLAVKLLIFTVILFIISIGRNSRGAFMVGFTSLGFAFGLGLMLGIIKTRLFTLRNAVILFFGIWLLTGPFSDLGTAMVLVRYQRDDIPKSELVGLTLEAYKDKKAIEQYLLNTKTRKTDWDESYLDNIFLARFCNIKFNDISISLASQIEDDNYNMRDFTINRIWAIFPQPLLNVLKPNFDKNEVVEMSFGDYLRYQVSKSPVLLGSYVSGNFSGTGMAAFGWWYLLILGIAMFPAYFLIDLLHVKNYVSVLPSVQMNSVQRRFSLCALLNLTSTFQFLPAESVANVIQFLLRGWLQMIVLYFVLFYVTKMISNLLDPIAHFFNPKTLS